MKRIFIVLISISVVFASCNKKKISKPHLSSDKDSITYYLGVFLGKQLKGSVDGITTNYNLGKIDMEVFKKAIEDVISGDSIKYTEKYMDSRIKAYIEKINKELGDKNLKEGNAFIEKNKTVPGVIVTQSGLQYQVIKQGNGPKPDSSDICIVNYKGSLINGEVFQSNNGQRFPVTGVVPGMTEALLKMNVGSKWKLFIPSNLAYGVQGRQGTKIGPNMALIFELEVLSIEPKQAQQPQQMPAQMVAPMNKTKRK